MHTFFIAPTGFGVGLTSISLGLVGALERAGLKVGFFKPIAQPHQGDMGPERSSELIARTHGLYSPKPLALAHVERMLGDGQLDELLEEIISVEPGALKSPAPFVRFEDFADSYLLFSIYFWSEDVYGVENIKSEIRTKIFEKFRDNNIDISLPQRVLHFENNELNINLKQNDQATPDESGS